MCADLLVISNPSEVCSSHNLPTQHEELQKLIKLQLERRFYNIGSAAYMLIGAIGVCLIDVIKMFYDMLHFSCSVAFSNVIVRSRRYTFGLEKFQVSED